MKAGEIWAHKENEAIQLKIKEYLEDDLWAVVYVNTYGDDGTPNDRISGKEIFKYFYLIKETENENN